MHKSFRFFAFIAFVFLQIFFCGEKIYAQQAWDTLYLRNNQKVYGELKGISLGKVKFDMEGINVAELKMNKIRTINATSKLYRIETINKKVFFSTLQQSAKPGYVWVVDSTGGAEMPLDYIGLLSYFSDKRTIFEGNASAGYNYTKSSDIGRVNIDATLRYIFKKVVLQNVISAIVTSDQGVWYRDRESFSLSSTFLLNYKWKALALLNYQRNRELGLESRFQEGAGVGYNIISKTHLRFATLTGLVVNQEKGFEDESYQVTAEIPVAFDFDFFRFNKPEFSFSTNQNVYFSVTQQGRVRYDGEIRADWKVISDFTLNLKFYYNYDNKPLSGSGVSFDYGTVFGIGYKWD